MTVIGPRRIQPPRSRPVGFEPPYDAFEPRFRDCSELVMVSFGLEQRGCEPGTARERLLAALSCEPRPFPLEHAATRPGYGVPTEIWFAYWPSWTAYSAWSTSSGIEELFGDDRFLSGDTGLWRETCRLSLDHNETSASRSERLTGLANLADALEVTDIHAYWGSMRDRIVAAAGSELTAAEVDLKHVQSAIGRRVRIVAPDNACLIKTTQDFALTSPEQLELYETCVEPAFTAGIEYIRASRLEAGCIGMRFLEETERGDAPRPRTLGYAYFRSLGDLERWTHHHPTHQAIMGQFMDMVQKFGGEPGLSLWHEVTVFPHGSLTGDYVNCNADGSLLGSAQS